ncbi:putative WRKY transcription factor 41 [Iris pallida]|uniref:WRKY transcription factor 41 n=1 Tax=Iris pallida TaxID=29817 RepID=A0AAX6GL11_IRIPA|nr:putative WRKY transcription factor 41 [Iris pallida]KAJ6829449.1 putative WRKY transcription factor 41 [Iris pallida]
MEIGSSSMVVDEMARGREMARQLQADIDSGFSVDTCRALVKEILSAFDKTISMVTSGAMTIGNGGQQAADGTELPPWSVAKSLRAENSSGKKRKMLPKWTSQVRLGSGPGVEVGDGYSWRKYGQKEILGAKHPRGYYRCSHRNTQGCLAMKQVQRSEENPLVFDVTYRGTHTCERRPSAKASASRDSLLLQQQQGQQQQQQNQDLLLSFQTGLKVKTEGLDFKSPEPSSSSLSFSFPSTPVESLKPETLTFSPSSTLDNCHLVGCGGVAFSNEFISPATSESNYFSMSPCHQMSSYGGQALQAAESEFAEIISAAATCTSATNSPMLDMDFLLDAADLDQANFPFDACSFLS